jgi:P-type E1-E2 ATPase
MTSLKIDLPGKSPLVLEELILDFNGTLARDGRLIDGVAEDLRALAKSLRITVLTADTFGTVAEALRDLSLSVRTIATGADKALIVGELGPERVVAIGNGRNDVAMLRAAALGIAVLGPEGTAGEAIAAADIVVREIHDALDLLTNPTRITATLRD